VIKGGNRAQARNLGIKLAEGKIIAFIDSDCEATKDWLSTLVSKLMQNKPLGGIGGVNLSPSESPLLGKAIDFVFSSYLGSLGSSSLYTPTKPVFVSALACINSAFWKKDLRSVGGFDEDFELCEDTNLSYKVRALGHKLLLDPKILVWHNRRDTIRRFAKQFFSYGMGRMRSILTNKDYANKGALFPFTSFLLFPLISLFFPFLVIAFFTVYLSAGLIIGFHGAKKLKVLRLLLLIPALFIIEHFTYFFGMIYGAIKGKWKKPHETCDVFHREIVTK
jgi:GT2 family glycosyltransferase